MAKVCALADLDRLAAQPLSDVKLWVPDRLHQPNAAALFGVQRGGLRQDRVTVARISLPIRLTTILSTSPCQPPPATRSGTNNAPEAAPYLQFTVG
jgi:hypothetical protein